MQARAIQTRVNRRLGTTWFPQVRYFSVDFIDQFLPWQRGKRPCHSVMIGNRSGFDSGVRDFLEEG